MTNDALKYGLLVGDTFPDGREGRSEHITIVDISPDGSVFQIRYSGMSEDDLCPYITSDHLFQILNIDKETKRHFSYDDMLLAFAGGFLTAGEVTMESATTLVTSILPQRKTCWKIQKQKGSSHKTLQHFSKNICPGFSRTPASIR